MKKANRFRLLTPNSKDYFKKKQIYNDAFTTIRRDNFIKITNGRTRKNMRIIVYKKSLKSTQKRPQKAEQHKGNKTHLLHVYQNEKLNELVSKVIYVSRFCRYQQSWTINILRFSVSCINYFIFPVKRLFF